IMTLAKGLAGGVPIGALLAKEPVAAAFQPGDHASTFGGNPLAAACGVAVLETILGEGFLARVREISSYLVMKLEELQRKHPVVKEVRGRGLLLGMELDVPAAGVVSACREKGLLVNGVGEKILRFLPPLIITEAEVDEAVAVLDEALGQASRDE